MRHSVKAWLCAVLSSLMLLTGMALADALPTGQEAEAPTSAEQQIETPASAVQQAETTAEAQREKAAWTVMIYLCGTDLESDGGMATYNLSEIASTQANDEVNVVFQTGGTRSWAHAKEELEMEIATGKLQRWRYGTEGFALADEQALANMADGRTLTEFVRWTAQTYPAEKYLLIMWDHGGGSLGGLIHDELHKATMSLEDFGAALEAGGVHFEAIALDTCLMASLETAQALQHSANYLIAAEEVVAGFGTAYNTWLQYLYDYPQANGRQFGRYFCNAVQTKYAEIDDDYTNKILTFSAIDLSRIDAVTEAFEAMFAEIRELLADPEQFGLFSDSVKNAERYYDKNMVDLSDMARRASKNGVSIQTAGAVIEAVADAVVDDVRGSSHSYSQGLSFWYGLNSSVSTLDHFARNCKNPSYLAFLDQVSMGWTAPAWVYEQVERRPDIRYDDYVIEYELSATDDGHVQMTVTNGKKAVSAVDYRLLRHVDQENDLWITLGIDYNVAGSFDTGVFRDAFTGKWPAIGTTLCYMDMVDSTDTYSLYNMYVGVPKDSRNLKLGYDFIILRTGFLYDQAISSVYTASQTEDAAETVMTYDGSISGHYEIFGAWNGMDNNIFLPSRDVMPLDSLYGVKLRSLAGYYDLWQQTETGSFYSLGSCTLDGNTKIELTTLPRGKYAYEFVITDVFGRQITTRSVPFTWDGQKAVFRVDE